MEDDARKAAVALIDGESPSHAGIARTLIRFGACALNFAGAHGTRIVALNEGETYYRRSAALQRLRIDVDRWPAPPAGLFVVEERTVYLRSRSAMTVAHEFGHALDCALGRGIYRSSLDPHLRRLFESATHFVTPYASTSVDEYFAENVRAYVEANDEASFWPRATRERLLRLDPLMHRYVEELFAGEFAATASTLPALP